VFVSSDQGHGQLAYTRGPGPLVSKHGVGHIHALMIDTLTNFPTELIRTRALRNEKMVIEELEKNADVYRTELRDCLVDYYEQILKMDGAGGIPRSSTFKHKFKRGFVAAAPSRDAAAAALDDDEHTNGGEGDGQEPDATAEDGADANKKPPPEAAAPASAAEEADDGKKKGVKPVCTCLGHDSFSLYDEVTQ
jgi:hypothetical protein